MAPMFSDKGNAFFDDPGQSLPGIQLLRVIVDDLGYVPRPVASPEFHKVTGILCKWTFLENLSFDIVQEISSSHVVSLPGQPGNQTSRDCRRDKYPRNHSDPFPL